MAGIASCKDAEAKRVNPAHDLLCATILPARRGYVLEPTSTNIVPTYRFPQRFFLRAHAHRWLRLPNLRLNFDVYHGIS